MQGDTVVVRTLGGQPKIVRVWQIKETFILICSEENYKSLKNGNKGLMPVGIPKQDVFRYNPSQDKMLKNWQRDSNLWNHLVNYV